MGRKGMLSWRDRYEVVISSDSFLRLLGELVSSNGNRCQRCDIRRSTLRLRHLSYERLGRESPEDLELLCEECWERSGGQVF